MSEVLNKPQFQVLTHSHTGEKIGRIYFPALFLAEFYTSVSQWLQRREVMFSEQDIKQYADGSFRIYFRTKLSPETEYFHLITMIGQQSLIA